MGLKDHSILEVRFFDPSGYVVPPGGPQVARVAQVPKLLSQAPQDTWQHTSGLESLALQGNDGIAQVVRDDLWFLCPG